MVTECDIKYERDQVSALKYKAAKEKRQKPECGIPLSALFIFIFIIYFLNKEKGEDHNCRLWHFIISKLTKNNTTRNEVDMRHANIMITDKTATIW